MKLADLQVGDVIKYCIEFTGQSQTGIAIVKSIDGDTIFLKDLINFVDKKMVGVVWNTYLLKDKIIIQKYFGNTNPANILPDEYKFLLPKNIF